MNSDFSVTILGCGSAKPTLRHHTTAQVVQHHGNLFLIDCGEGVQRQMVRCGISMAKIGHIFLSHLHGDHCLGLVGLISTLGLGQRTGKIVIHAHKDAERIFLPLFEFFCPQLSMEVEFQTYDYSKSEVIYEDKTLKVITIPLHHRMPCAGFLFEEKTGRRHLKVEECERLEIPTAYYQGITLGSDWELPSGEIIPNVQLTTDPTPPRTYAYCSDTMYSESVVPLVKDVDLLYHEATYGDENLQAAKERGHSTARQAAHIAKLANAKRLIIGHFSSRYDAEGENELLKQAQEEFAETELAKEKKVFEL